MRLSDVVSSLREHSNRPSGATHYRECACHQEAADGLPRIEWFKQNDGGPGASWFIWDRQHGWREEMGWEEYRQYSGQRPERLVLLENR